MNEHGAPVLYALVTGSPPARDVGKLVAIAQADGWDVCVIASPDGKRFIDVDALTVKTGHPVYSEYAEFEQPGLLPAADAMIVAPLTCNSLAKWAVRIVAQHYSRSENSLRAEDAEIICTGAVFARSSVINQWRYIRRDSI
ncbi:flavoprotein [Nocardia sp. NPDC055321]